MPITDSLHTILQEIEAYCTRHRIPLFFDDFNMQTKGMCVLPGNHPKERQRYLTNLRRLGSKILHITVIRNEPRQAVKKEKAHVHSDSFNASEKQASEEGNATAGFDSYLRLTFFHEDIAYRCIIRAESAEKTVTVSPQQATHTPRKAALKDRHFRELINTGAGWLLQSNAYLKAGSPRRRQEVAERRVNLAGVDGVYHLAVFQSIERIYQKQVQQTIDAENVESLKTLLHTGKGMTREEVQKMFQCSPQKAIYYLRLAKSVNNQKRR